MTYEACWEALLVKRRAPCAKESGSVPEKPPPSPLGHAGSGEAEVVAVKQPLPCEVPCTVQFVLESVAFLKLSRTYTKGVVGAGVGAGCAVGIGTAVGAEVGAGNETGGAVAAGSAGAGGAKTNGDPPLPLPL